MTKTVLLMATYNGARHLKPQLDSIRQQSAPADQVIFRDDASTDDTVSQLTDYIAKHQLTEWQILRNPRNIGWRANFHQLMRDAQPLEPDILFFADQDDIWDLHKNEYQLELLSARPDIDLVTGDFTLRKTTATARQNHYHDFADAATAPLSIYPPRLRYRSYRPGWTMAVRQSLVRDALTAWPPAIEVNHDALLEGLASLLGTGYNLNRPLGQHLRHESNASGRPFIRLSSPRADHLRALRDYQGFYSIEAQVLRRRDSPRADRAQAEADFYQRRYEAARSGNKSRIASQILRDWRRYECLSGRIRDILFAFKK